jgi:hypothetical protein
MKSCERKRAVGGSLGKRGLCRKNALLAGRTDIAHFFAQNCISGIAMAALERAVSLVAERVGFEPTKGC